MIKREQLIIAVVAAAVIGFFIGRLTGPRRPPPQSGDTIRGAPSGNDSSQIPISGLAVRGTEEAKVTVVVFSEFQCPFSGRVNPTLDSLLKAYPNEIKLVFRHNPLGFHKQAFLAAEATLAAGAQGKFWEMHDKLFANQRSLKQPDLLRYAREIGLDTARYTAELGQHLYKAQVEADQKMAARLGAGGTPNFFINGIRLKGAQPLERFKEIIDKELVEVNQALKAGTPIAQVYARRVEANYKPPKPRPDSKKKPRKPRRKEDPATVYKVPMPVGDPHIKGAEQALVTIMEFSEFQCPFCKRVNPTLKRLLEAYPNELRIIFRHNPLGFHKHALGASMATLAAGEQGKFWEMHDILFANTRSLQKEKLEGYAREVGLNMDRFQAFMKAHRGSERIDADQRLAKQLGARGTPGFFINGRKLSGARPFEDFHEVVKEELTRARALLKAGARRAGLYERLVADGATRPVYLPEEQQEKGASKDKIVRKAVKLGHAPSRGGSRPDAEILIFSDFQCPFSAKVVKMIDRVAREYGQRVRIAFKQNPLAFHKDAFGAAEASLAAHEQGKFWEMHDIMFRNQRALEMDGLESYAREIGLDVPRFKEAMASGKLRAKVEEDMAEARSLGARGTPTFFVNGRLVRGAVPYEKFKAILDEEIQAKK